MTRQDDEPASGQARNCKGATEPSRLFYQANDWIGRRKLSLADSAKIKDKFPLGQFAGPKLT
jgi:hypothetical protein